MGNRAYIIIKSPYQESKDALCPAIYLQWNGGPDSVYAFLDYVATVTRLDDMFAARLVQVIGNYIDNKNDYEHCQGEALSLRLNAEKWSERASLSECGDNGVYCIDLAKWKYGQPVTERYFESYPNGYDKPAKHTRAIKSLVAAERNEAVETWNQPSGMNSTLPSDVRRINDQFFSRKPDSLPESYWHKG